MKRARDRRSGERTGRATARRRNAGIHQLPWGQPVNRYPKLDLLSRDEIEFIHDHSIGILEDIGGAFHDADAVDLFRRAGALVDRGCTSFEKFVLDVDMLQQIAVYLEPVAINPETLSLEEIAAVGPGGHYFGTETTIAAFEEAFHRPLVFTGMNFEAWQERGSKDAARRAHDLYRRALAEYEEPVLPADRREALDAFVARRSQEGGAPVM